jgi:hypothetical protein
MQRSPGSIARTLRTPNSEGMRVCQAQGRRRIPRLVLMACLAALAVSQAFLPSAQAGAGPCRVPSNAYPTIQAAVNDATCATINVAAGTYTEHVTIARNVMIRGAGQDSTVVDGGRSGRVFTVAGSTVMIKDVTIQRGWVANLVEGYVSGGGIWNAGTLTVENSTISGTRGVLHGGGIWNEGMLTIKNSTIADNATYYAGSGGGIFNFDGGTVTLTDVIIADNSAYDGGGIFNFDGGTVTLTHVTFQNNIPNDCTGCPGLL